MPNAAKRQKNLAQGFNPGFDVCMRCALKGHRMLVRDVDQQGTTVCKTTPSGATFRAHSP